MQEKNLQFNLQHKAVLQFFFHISVFWMTDQQIFSLACYKQLKEVLQRHFNEMQLICQSSECLYTAVYLNHFFHLALCHITVIIFHSFDFICTIWYAAALTSDQAKNLVIFVRLCDRNKLFCDDAYVIIAFSFFMNVYSQNAHDESCLHQIAVCLLITDSIQFLLNL